MCHAGIWAQSAHVRGVCGRGHPLTCTRRTRRGAETLGGGHRRAGLLDHARRVGRMEGRNRACATQALLASCNALHGRAGCALVHRLHVPFTWRAPWALAAPRRARRRYRDWANTAIPPGDRQLCANGHVRGRRTRERPSQLRARQSVSSAVFCQRPSRLSMPFAAAQRRMRRHRLDI
jgi:hypothetical protein